MCILKPEYLFVGGASDKKWYYYAVNTKKKILNKF